MKSKRSLNQQNACVHLTLRAKRFEVHRLDVCLVLSGTVQQRTLLGFITIPLY